MRNWTFNRFLYTSSLIAIIISSISLIMVLFSDTDSGNTVPVYRIPDLEQICGFPEGVPLYDWRMILIHHSGETGETIEALKGYYMGRDERIPFHFLIRSDGAVFPTAAWKKQEWCAQTEDDEYNRQSIGVCVIGNFSLPESLPEPEQMSSLAALVKYLMDNCRIPGRYVWQRGEVADPKDSPGRNFPWKQFLRSLK